MAITNYIFLNTRLVTLGYFLIFRDLLVFFYFNWLFRVIMRFWCKFIIEIFPNYLFLFCSCECLWWFFYGLFFGWMGSLIPRWRIWVLQKRAEMTKARRISSNSGNLEKVRLTLFIRLSRVWVYPVAGLAVPVKIHRFQWNQCWGGLDLQRRNSNILRFAYAIVWPWLISNGQFARSYLILQFGIPSNDREVIQRDELMWRSA